MCCNQIIFFKCSSRLLEDQFYSYTVCRLLKVVVVVGGTPYNGLLGDSGTFFRYQVYEKVGNSRGSLIDKMFRKDSRSSLAIPFLKDRIVLYE